MAVPAVKTVRALQRAPYCVLAARRAEHYSSRLRRNSVVHREKFSWYNGVPKNQGDCMKNYLTPNTLRRYQELPPKVFCIDNAGKKFS